MVCYRNFAFHLSRAVEFLHFLTSGQGLATGINLIEKGKKFVASYKIDYVLFNTIFGNNKLT
jgi:hypothetical protein